MQRRRRSGRRARHHTGAADADAGRDEVVADIEMRKILVVQTRSPLSLRTQIILAQSKILSIAAQQP